MKCRYINTEPIKDHKPDELESSRNELQNLIPSWRDLHKKLDLSQPSTEKVTKDATLEQLMNAGVHFGHSTDIWHRNMLPFIYGRRSGIHIIDLEHTLSYLRTALNVTSDIALKGGTILFVGMRPFLRDILVNSARYSGQFYVHEKWLYGCLQNHAFTLKKATVEGVLIQPDLIVILDMKESEYCLKESSLVNVPTVGLCDTDCDPNMVTYPIPGNDDSYSSVEMISYLLASAARDGVLERQRIRASQKKSKNLRKK